MGNTSTVQIATTKEDRFRLAMTGFDEFVFIWTIAVKCRKPSLGSLGEGDLE
jgi:hypothetical protein